MIVLLEILAVWVLLSAVTLIGLNTAKSIVKGRQ